MRLTIAQLAQRIDAKLIGNGSDMVSAVGAIETAGSDTITFVSDAKHIQKLKNSNTAAVIVAEPIEWLNKPQLIVKNVNSALIEALHIFSPELKPVTEGIDPTAKIGQDVNVAPGVSIGPYVVIEDNVRIGQNSIILAGCKIGQNATLGKNCRIDCNVVIHHNCRIGNNVIIQANTTIGSTGFGYSFIDGEHRLLPHNGGVLIEDCVEIGANCCVDRAKFGDTIIGAGTKIDNLVQIAHNVIIGKCCLIAGQAGISGSCKIGDGVVLAGQAGLTDNIEVGNGVIVGAQSGVTHNIPPGQQLFGMPATEKTKAFRIISLTRRLPKIAEQLKQLAARVKKLEENI
jgi:UDP-3-O-[3-hydroxymyristoyl] glucosamine N-acyltransferase